MRIAFRELLPVGPTVVLVPWARTQPPAPSTQVWVCGGCSELQPWLPGLQILPWRTKEQAWKKSCFLGGMLLTFIVVLENGV